MIVILDLRQLGKTQESHLCQVSWSTRTRLAVFDCAEEDLHGGTGPEFRRSLDFVLNRGQWIYHRFLSIVD